MGGTTDWIVEFIHIENFVICQIRLTKNVDNVDKMRLLVTFEDKHSQVNKKHSLRKKLQCFLAISPVNPIRVNTIISISEIACSVSSLLISIMEAARNYEERARHGSWNEIRFK